MNLKKKRSFFDRLTGKTGFEDDERDEYYEEDDVEEIAIVEERGVIKSRGPIAQAQQQTRSTWMEEQVDEGELTIDMYHTPENLVVRTMIPGVKKEDLDISISRDSLTIRGKRVEESRISDQNYYHRELYWGAFSRTVELPHEIDIEQSEAIEKDGLLTLTLPRIDKGRQTKLKIKSL